MDDRRAIPGTGGRACGAVTAVAAVSLVLGRGDSTACRETTWSRQVSRPGRPDHREWRDGYRRSCAQHRRLL